MKILNVIYSEPLINHGPVDYVNYVDAKDIIVESLGNDPCAVVLDHTKLIIGPVLVVGYGLYKRLYGATHKIDIFKKELVKNTLYWEFSFNENKSQYFAGLFDFLYKNPLNNYYSLIKYENLDPIFHNINKEADIYEKLKDRTQIYMSTGMMYIYSKQQKIVYGLDLVAYKYFDFDVESIVTYLCGDDIKVSTDTDGNIFRSYFTMFPQVETLRRYIVLLLENNSK